MSRAIRRMGLCSSLQVLLLICLGALCPPAPLAADEVRVAVASNFAAAMTEIVDGFEAQSEHRVTVVLGSTGKLYAQIRHGAPFAVFLAADAERPRLLEEQGVAVAGSRFTYAVGRLALWSAQPGRVTDGAADLAADDFTRLAIANPKLAPYGRAAQQVLENLNLWSKLQSRLVRGENISQALHFVYSGNAELGLVSLAQIRGSESVSQGSYWLVPAELHDPIVQQAVLLRDEPAARAFLEFLRQLRTLEIMARFGYDTTAGTP